MISQSTLTAWNLRWSAQQIRSMKFAGIGYALAFVISSTLLRGHLVHMWYYVLWAGASLLVINLALANPVSHYIAGSRLRALIGGPLYAWVVVLGSTISCGILSLVINLSLDLYTWIVKPLYAVLIVGGVPAILLGIAFGELTWRTRH
jgi:hypothetical protein